MHKILLNGTWELAFGPQRTHKDISRNVPSDWQHILATVPGNVELDMVSAGIIPEPSFASNIYKLREYESYEWKYSRTFASPDISKSQTVELVLEGLDCIADIWLNEVHIGHTENMLIGHSIPVTDLLRPAGEQNTLEVLIQSAVLHGRAYTPEPVNYAFSPNWESLRVRKAPHMYGWDIMPRLVSAGLWRDVMLCIQDETYLSSVYWVTQKVDVDARTATVLVDWDFRTQRHDIDNLAMHIEVAGNMRDVPVVATHGRARIDLQNVDLWWPRGHGKPALYDARIDLLDEQRQVIASNLTRLGLRTVSCNYTDITTPENPGEFVFIVNGERIFVKGTNWVPLDAFHSRDHLHLDAAMEMVADLNCNMVRCWGGNVYEDHPFFDRCDQLGIMVWQDFAMACAIYPQTDEFAQVIQHEAEVVVRKLRNHCSLVLWAGNNEIDETYEWAGEGIDPNTDILSRQVLPAVIRRLDPSRPYLPSSPYRSPVYVREQQKLNCLPSRFNAQPEQHLWGPRTDFKSPFYKNSLAHFASEIGYHGCPDRQTLEQFLDAEHLWPWQNNDQWLTHATRPLPGVTDFNYRIKLMSDQIKVLFSEIPENLDDYILASQIIQAEALKFFIEWFRQAKWRRTGIVWWNLRDGWPIISDAVVDYYNRRKLAYEYIKRVQTDVCVMVAEPHDGVHDIVIVNDTRNAAHVSTVISDVDTGKIVYQGGCDVVANGIVTLDKIDSCEFDGMLKVEFVISNTMPMRNHYLLRKAPIKLADYRRWLSRLDLPVVK